MSSKLTSLIAWAAYAISNDDGTVNQEATKAKFETDLASYSELQEKDLPLMNAKVIEIFSKHPHGTMIKKPLLVTLLMNEVGFSKDTYDAIMERAVNVIDNNDRIYIVKGPGAGAAFMSDKEYDVFQKTKLNPSEVKIAAKEATKAAKKALKDAAAAE